ncbi:hypothetical protein DHEL01_v205258 [Diaporthe helianthi]|uniref:Piwi domain-containing protein n=1 Tax=Diaporthe helianthi TaxID=158607 RepID=A0A2P5I1H5_DIAHE|nr:hypothetical protein DHEL01_v205258 [Diaporthe helianthi]
MHKGIGEAGRPLALGLPKSRVNRAGLVEARGAALPPRPPPVQLLTNHFGLTFTVESFPVYKYTFKVLNSSDEVFTRIEAKAENVFEFVKGGLPSIGAQPGEYATDYRQQIVSLKPLKIPKNQNKRLDDEGSGGWAIEFGDTVEVRLGNSALASPSPDVIECLRLILGHSSREENQIATVKWPRFFRGADDQNSRNPFQGRDIPEAVSAVFLEGRTFSDIFDALKKKTGAGSTAWLTGLTNLHGAVARTMVSYELPGKESEKVRISGFARRDDRDSKSKDAVHGLKIERDFPGSTEVRFWFKNEYRTVWDHFKKVRNLDLSKHLPLINIGKPGRPEYVPAEYCQVLGPRELDKLNKSTCQSSESRQVWFRFGHNLQELKTDSGSSRVLSNFHIVVHDKEPLKVTGRELDNPRISYCETQSLSVPPEASWKLAERSLAKGPRTQKSWTWIYLGGDSRNDVRQAEDGIKNLDDTLKKMCAKGFPPRRINSDAPVTPDDIAAIRACLARATLKHNDLVVVISPNRLSKDTYKALKFFGDIQSGVHTSCILLNKFRKKGKDGQENWNYGYFRNVALKINMKLGGTSHVLEQDLGVANRNALMVVGYGTSRLTEKPQTPATKGGDGKAAADRPQKPLARDQSSHEIEKEPSQVGLVISADEKLGQWQSSYWNQDPKQKVTGANFTARLRTQIEFWKSTKAMTLNKPMLSVVIYRYGVSESQIETALNQEVPVIRETFKKVFDAKPVQITLVVAIKGHAIRFFPMQVGGGSEVSRNIKPGTVVDNIVTRHRYREFFLASHFAHNGNTKPARYVVLVDEVFNEGDASNPDPVHPSGQLEKFTHDLCYLFGRATKAVGICTPAYYIDILCSRARLYNAAAAKDEIKREVEKSIQDVGVKRRILAREIHRDLANSMYWI